MTDTLNHAATHIETLQQQWKQEETEDALATVWAALDEVAEFAGTLRGARRDQASELVDATYTALKDLINVIDLPVRGTL